MTTIGDLGCYDQALWGVLHKGFLLNSSLFSQSFNWLGIHFNPVLYLFVPFYYFLPTVNWFIFAQTAALSIAALPIFSLARQVTSSEKQALLWSVIYLFNPFVLSADAWDFHPVNFAVPFMALSFLAIEQQSLGLFTFANLTLLLCQEQFGLAVAGFGLLYGLKNQEKQVSCIFIVMGIISILFILAVVMPSLSPTKQHVMLGGHSGENIHLNRYNWLGYSLKAVINTLIFSPLHVFKTVVFEFQGMRYLILLSFPFLLTEFAAPSFMLPMIADLLANMLSANPMQRNISNLAKVFRCKI